MTEQSSMEIKHIIISAAKSPKLFIWKRPQFFTNLPKCIFPHFIL